MTHNKARNAALEADIKRLESQLSTSKVRITEEVIARFAEKMAATLRDKTDPFHSEYVRLFVSRAELSGRKI